MEIPGPPCQQKTENVRDSEGDAGRDTLPVATGTGGLDTRSEPDEQALSGSASLSVRQEPHLCM